MEEKFRNELNANIKLCNLYKVCTRANAIHGIGLLYLWTGVILHRVSAFHNFKICYPKLCLRSLGLNNIFIIYDVQFSADSS